MDQSTDDKCNPNHWYWSNEWQDREREADADLSEGRFQVFDSIAEFAMIPKPAVITIDRVGFLTMEWIKPGKRERLLVFIHEDGKTSAALIKPKIEDMEDDLAVKDAIERIFWVQSENDENDTF